MCNRSDGGTGRRALSSIRGVPDRGLAGELKFYEHKINRRTHVHRFFG